MKTKLSKLTKAILFCFIIVLSSCENEKYEKYGESEKSETQAYLDLSSAPFSNKRYTLDELPKDIKEFYYKVRNINPNQSNQKTSNTTDAIYAENSIVGNTDQKNNSNYSVGYFFEDTPKNIIYNLVINKDSTGTIIEKRYKYICNPSDYENFKSHNFDFKYFVGVTEVSSVPSNSGSKSTSKTADDTSPCIDALPCIRILPSAPSGSFGGSSTSDGAGFNTTVLGYNTSAGTGNYSATFGGTTYYSGGGSSGSTSNSGSTACNNHALCIPDAYGGYNYRCGDLISGHTHRIIKNNNKTTSGDPCDPCANNPLATGYVPINLAPYYLQSIKSVIPFTKSQWLFLSSNDAVVHQLWYFIDFNPTVLTDEYKQFIMNLVQKMQENPTLKLDINASFKSPYNIDRSSISIVSPEGKRFHDIYNALTESPEYKKLFVDLFGTTQTRFNVRFKIADAVFDPHNPTKEVNAKTTYDGSPVLVITVNKKILIAGTGMSQTNIENAKTVLHESIHAYLFIKSINPTNGMDIAGIINNMYPTPNEQHDFMYGKMIPTMQKVLGEIRDLVTTQNARNEVESLTMHPTRTPLTSEPWSWDKYYFYLSLNGLHETTCFLQDYPKDSNPHKFFQEYNGQGKLYLGKQ